MQYKNTGQLILGNINSQKRIPGLDILRSAAILLVLVSHAVFNILGSFIPQKLSACIFILGGSLGVEIFFVLSGFLIGKILIDLFWKTSSFNFKAIRQFWVRRWFRTIPNYLLALFIYIMIYMANGGFNFYAYRFYFVFMQNFAWEQPYLFGVSWSLTIEEWFYILFPLALMLFYFLFSFKKKQALVSSVLFFLIGIGLLRIIYMYTQHDVNWDNDVRKVVIFRLDSIVYGVGAALVYRFRLNWWKAAPGAFFITGLILIAANCFLMMKYIFWADTPNWLIEALTFPLISISITLIFPYIISLKINSESVGFFFTWISLISYSLYLISEFMFMLVFEIFGSPTSLGKAMIMVAAFFCLCFILATIQYRVFEKPLTSLRDKIKS